MGEDTGARGEVGAEDEAASWAAERGRVGPSAPGERGGPRARGRGVHGRDRNEAWGAES